MKTAIIYALCEPGTRTIRYIGMTTVGTSRRLRQHCKESSRLRGTYLGNWLRSLGEKIPSLIILSEVPQELWEDEEARYIKAARCLGMNLVNATEGGEGLVNPSPEVREKMSLARKGKKLTDETRRRMSVARTGIGNPNFGKVRSESHCAAIRRARANSGPLSLEHKKAISDSQRGEKNHCFGKTGPASLNWGKKHRESTSGFLGVAWCSRDTNWSAKLRVDKKSIWLGRFETEQEAARAYDAAAKQYFGASAKLNFQE